MGQKAIGYVRKSTISEGRSLREQEADLRRLADQLDAELVDVVAEEASAYAERERPKFTATLRRCETEGALLLCWSLDRFSRRGAEAVLPLFPRHGRPAVRLVTVDGVDTADPTRRLDVILRAELALQESQRISARVTRAKNADRSAGRWLSGPPPYGYRVGKDRKLRQDPKRAPVVRRIVQDVIAGRTLLRIARDLNEEGVPAPGGWRRGGGREWNTGHLSAILRNPALVGLLPSESGSDQPARGEDGAEISVLADGEQPIVTAAERARARAVLAGRRRPTGGPAGRQARSTLSGRVVCGRCLGPMVSCGGDYRCQARRSGSTRCEGVTVVRGRLEEEVADRVRLGLGLLATEWRRTRNSRDVFFWSPEAQGCLEAVAAVWGASETSGEAAERREAEVAVEEAREALRRADDAFADGLLDAERYARQVERLTARLRTAETALADAPAAPVATVEQLVERIEQGGVEAVDAIVPLAVREVLVRPAARRGGRFDPARVVVMLVGNYLL